MTYPKKLKERTIQLANEGLSAEEIADTFSKEAGKKQHDYTPNPRTIRNWINRSEKKQSLNEAISQIRDHDIEIFKKSDSIMNGQQMVSFLWPLDGGPPIYYHDQARKMGEFLDFYNYESNQYVDRELNKLCHNLCSALNELGKFLAREFRTHSRYYDKDDNWSRLIPGELSHIYYSGGDIEGPLYWEYYDQLQVLKSNCEVSLKNYRAYIRDVLYK